MPVIFSDKNWIDAKGVVFTPDSEVTELKAVNLANRLIFKVWRTVFPGDMSSTESAVSIDLGVDRTGSVLFLQFPRYSGPDDFDEVPDVGEDATVRILFSTTDAHDGDVYDTGVITMGVLQGFGTWSLVLDEPVTARYIRVVIDSPSRINEGFQDVCRFWFGPASQTTFGVDVGDVRAWDADSILAKAAQSSATFVNPGEPIRNWTYSFGLIFDDEVNMMEDLERRMGKTGQFVVIRQEGYDTRRGEMLSRFTSSSGLTAVTWDQNSKAMRIVEDY